MNEGIKRRIAILEEALQVCKEIEAKQTHLELCLKEKEDTKDFETLPGIWDSRAEKTKQAIIELENKYVLLHAKLNA